MSTNVSRIGRIEEDDYVAIKNAVEVTLIVANALFYGLALIVLIIYFKYFRLAIKSKIKKIETQNKEELEMYTMGQYTAGNNMPTVSTSPTIQINSNNNNTTSKVQQKSTNIDYERRDFDDIYNHDD